MNRRVVALLVALSLCGAGAASAQVQTGEIFGRVSDTSNAVLPGVTVTLSSTSLLQPLTAVTSETGSYRFPRLEVGTYTVRFELPGFRTVVREGVRVEIGFNAQINAELGLATVEETVTVTGESPVVDTRTITTGSTFNQEMLQKIPNARDPWVMLEATPGISMDRQNVGGTASGQQSGYVARGASTSNNTWNMDGVSITDMSATGSSSIYFDFDMFEEMQISTGGNDASIQTGGVGVNIVTKSGTDVFKGSTRYYFISDDLQSNNIDAALAAQGAGSGNPVQEIKDYGIEAGGPIKKGRAWLWGSYGSQDVGVGVPGFLKPGCVPASSSPEDQKPCLNTDLTTLDTFNVKAQALLFQGNKITWHSNWNDKVRNARDASNLRPPETVTVQTGPVWTHKLSDQHIFSDRLLMDVSVARVGGGFDLSFPDAALASVQRDLELTGVPGGRPANSYARSFSGSTNDRPQTSFDLSASYFLPGKLGGDHSFKTGFRYRTTPTEASSHIGGFTTARFRAGVASEADLHRDSATAYGLQTFGFHLQDTYTRGRLTLNLGFRIDRQDDEARASSVQANPIVPDFLPAVNFAGADSGVVWTNLSPRIGLTYDVFGSGRSVAKASYARYYGQMSPSALAGILNPVTAAQVRFPWNDLNGDRFVQRNELDTTQILNSSGNYDPRNPNFVGTANTVDPNIKNDTTDELIVSFDQEMPGGFAVGAAYVWRRYGNFLWDRTVDFGPDDWRAVPFTAGGVETVYYEPVRPLSFVLSRENWPDRTREFQGLELTVRRRFANRFMISGSAAFNDAQDVIDSPAGYGVFGYYGNSTQRSGDPTEVASVTGGQYAPEQTGSGRSQVFNNARWLLKGSGLYAAPWDINLSVSYDGHQGYPFIRSVLSPARANGAGQIQIPVEAIGETRLEDVHLWNFRVEKVFTIAGRFRPSLSFDLFNMLNANQVLIRERQQNATSANSARDITPPRVARLGVRFVW